MESRVNTFPIVIYPGIGPLPRPPQEITFTSMPSTKGEACQPGLNQADVWPLMKGT